MRSQSHSCYIKFRSSCRYRNSQNIRIIFLHPPNAVCRHCSGVPYICSSRAFKNHSTVTHNITIAVIPEENIIQSQSRVQTRNLLPESTPVINPYIILISYSHKSIIQKHMQSPEIKKSCWQSRSYRCSKQTGNRINGVKSLIISQYITRSCITKSYSIKIICSPQIRRKYAHSRSICCPCHIHPITNNKCIVRLRSRHPVQLRSGI